MNTVDYCTLLLIMDWIGSGLKKWSQLYIYTQDLTVTIASQRSEDEIVFKDDELQRSTINVESFVDAQEWRLYDEVETYKDTVSKFYQGDEAENCKHPTFSCRTHATRRAGFYITNIFVVMVTLLLLLKSYSVNTTYKT